MSEPGQALEIKTPETPELSVPEEPTIVEELGYVIAVLEERGDGELMHLVERLRTIVARLDGSIQQS